MRGFEGGVGRTRIIVPALASLIFALLPEVAWSDSTDPIPDIEITADEFDDTIAFTPDDDTEAAIPPLEVHEIDAAKATAAGGQKVVDGRVWLDADDYDRNDILNEVEADLPKDTILVIDVSTGDIWQVPLADGALLPDGFRPWTDEEYDWLDEDWYPPRISWGPLTVKGFLRVGAVDKREDTSDEIEPVRYLKTFGPIGQQEIRSLQGRQVALMATWLRETPLQRYLRMVMLYNYFSRLPQFQGADNRLIFALMVPDGALYALPYFQYRDMLARSGIQAWSLYDMAMLPVVLTLVDRQIRGERLVIGPLRD
ncbi:hypothetical protein [Dongia sp.]|uniref:hypothetical protein n=1 Tax=Dongia sp. TaxID=1977262 RepID=UPI0037507785